ncbi:hypothetical protein CBF34_07970 [Vagococcus penaei]|uniref:Uncharacterized protein n=1 Tax=Vagococcus penaei TaxID=633807 RepID=A0A1Q2D498_9ENTE|nr:hypothetical protein [Vagococcus penaei]AQP53224.1 hypothetical protein BW732_02560 [Vagococcus penaei]RSU01025.1 hypothetical protein CBF34_07970 [Vagococcus penaei]
MRKKINFILQHFDRLDWSLYAVTFGTFCLSIVSFINFNASLKSFIVPIGMLAIFTGFLSFVFFYRVCTFLSITDAKYLYLIHAFISISLGLSMIFNLFTNIPVATFLITLWLIINTLIHLAITLLVEKNTLKNGIIERVLSGACLILAIAININGLTKYIHVPILIGFYLLLSSLILLITYILPNYKKIKDNTLS